MITINSVELTATVTAIANVISCAIKKSELPLLSAILVQLGDTLATIVVAADMQSTES